MDFHEMRSALQRAIMTEPVTRYSVWEMMSRRQHVAKLADMVPAPVFAQVSEHARLLANDFSTVEQQLLAELRAMPFDEGDEAVEACLQLSENTDILRIMLSGDDYASVIWTMLKPETS